MDLVQKNLFLFIKMHSYQPYKKLSNQIISKKEENGLKK